MHSVTTAMIALVFIINPLLDDWNSESTDRLQVNAKLSGCGRAKDLKVRIC